jgi:hypothetical protein
MRVFLPLIFVVIFLAVLGLIFSGKSTNSNPLPNVQKFLKDIRDDNYEATVRDFGGNTCRCPAKLGWVAYLIYSSGEDPNLAFLMGKKFDVGELRVRKMKSTAKVKTVLDNPEDYEVDVPLSFNATVYQPYFLPTDLAYGHEISQQALQTFLDDPDKEAWKAIGLRLRKGIEKGSIAEPQETIDRLKRTDEEVNGKSDNVSAADLAREMFGEEAAKYSQPADCGAVKKADGSYMSRSELASLLPRLKSIELRLHMVRVDNRHPFTVFHFYLANPIVVVTSPGSSSGTELPATKQVREVVIEHYSPPLPVK